MASSSSSSLLGVTVAVVTATAVGAGSMWWYQKYRQSSVEQQNRKKFAIPSALLVTPYSKELILAVQLALKAGNNLIPYCNVRCTVNDPSHPDDNILGIETKGQPENFCTKVDIENELLIVEAIRKEFPLHCVIGEESVGTGDIPPQSTWQSFPTWIIDPIDGTTNFASALPLSCVSIGYCQPPHGTPVMGVVFSPMTQELFMAVRGYGAYRNGVRLALSTSSSIDSLATTTTTTTSTPSTKYIHRPTQLVDAIVNTEFGYVRSEDGIAIMIQALQRIMNHGCRAVRQLGSGVLDLCYVACGRLDVVYAGLAQEGFKPWDYCAAHVIVQETGCVMEPINNNNNKDDKINNNPAFDLYSTSIICAATPELLLQCRQVLTQKHS